MCISLDIVGNNVLLYNVIVIKDVGEKVDSLSVVLFNVEVIMKFDVVLVIFGYKEE